MRARWTLLMVAAAMMLACSPLTCGLLRGEEATPTPVPTQKPATPTPTTSTAVFEALPGTWSGTTRFGSFSFIVSSSGGEILRFNLIGQVPRRGGVYTVRYNKAWMIEGPLIDADGSFDLSDPESDPQLVFRGQFSPDGTAATGLWEMLSGSLSAEWSVQR